MYSENDSENIIDIEQGENIYDVERIERQTNIFEDNSSNNEDNLIFHVEEYDDNIKNCLLCSLMIIIVLVIIFFCIFKILENYIDNVVEINIKISTN